MRSGRELLQKALARVPKPGSTKHINLALSGGIDSSVSGLLLLESGWEVQAHTMRCWDDPDSSRTACWESEVRAARAAARHLKIGGPREVDLVGDYWTRVFDPFLRGVRGGCTGNADLVCNREIKFGAFMERVGGMVGTGHYARVEDGMLRGGVDERKDQSYFLGSVRREVLERVVFPVGWLRKEEVREIGKWAGLPGVREKSSRGMCFVGKQEMGEFLGRFVEGVDGSFVDVEGRLVGGMRWKGFGYTIGQRARVGGLGEAVYVVGRRGGDVVVAKEGDRRLVSGGVFCERVEWMDGERIGRVIVKTCSTSAKMGGEMRKVDGGWVVVFDREVRRVAEGQAVVLYDENDFVLGAAWPVEDGRAAKVLGEFMEVGWKDVVI